MTIEQSAWRLVLTKPRQELTAAEHLKRQGYSVYLPMLRRRKRRNGRQANTQAPLFPRYLFIHLTVGLDDCGPIQSTIGISGLVRFGMVPAQIPDDLIASIQAQEDEDGYHQEEAPEFRHGDMVRITDGPFSGYEAIFHTQRGGERVLIMLDVVGKATQVEITVETIAATD